MDPKGQVYLTVVHKIELLPVSFEVLHIPLSFLLGTVFLKVNLVSHNAIDFD